MASEKTICRKHPFRFAKAARISTRPEISLSVHRQSHQVRWCRLRSLTLAYTTTVRLCERLRPCRTILVRARIGSKPILPLPRSMQPVCRAEAFLVWVERQASEHHRSLSRDSSSVVVRTSDQPCPSLHHCSCRLALRSIRSDAMQRCGQLDRDLPSLRPLQNCLAMLLLPQFIHSRRRSSRTFLHSPLQR